MPKYLFQANYNLSGAQGLMRDGGTVRRDVIAQLFESLGGRLETFYFCYGKYDAIVIGDLPDNTAAAAASLTVGATGSAELQTTVLLTPAEVDEAVKRHPAYTAPGAPRSASRSTATKSTAATGTGRTTKRG